ncbi:hypothetical protein IH824_16600 [candidate division KSB1 bacterium]|nr:hypothetical protein [candidate division KSB1 bacterium]
MPKVNIKRLLFLTVGLSFLMVFGIRLLDHSLVNRLLQRSDLGNYNSYFRLFNELKEPQQTQTNHNFKSGESTQAPVLERDPFVRPGAHSSTNSLSGREKSFNQGDLELRGILWHNKFPSAVISGEVVQVGNMLGRFRVKRILKKQVILFSENGKIVLHLPEDESG